MFCLVFVEFLEIKYQKKGLVVPYFSRFCAAYSPVKVDPNFSPQAAKHHIFVQNQLDEFYENFTRALRQR